MAYPNKFNKTNNYLDVTEYIITEHKPLIIPSPVPTPLNNQPSDVIIIHAEVSLACYIIAIGLKHF